MSTVEKLAKLAQSKKDQFYLLLTRGQNSS
ncbi:hypothetical protein SAMN05878482_102838 [Peribacillus simplex]|uniref:Uncharacterized protein n=1 Tax=Peribacillus simplex TaxID=1478 RepID=A0A9X8R8E8_9BACI|nr:hypothetical protein SAMN05878482_102838 [Peribacillus simplex]